MKSKGGSSMAIGKRQKKNSTFTRENVIFFGAGTARAAAERVAVAIRPIEGKSITRNIEYGEYL